MVTFSVEKPGIIRNTLSFIVYQPIYNLFVALLTFLPEHSLGWAIIILTIIIRMILLVPQNHMLEWQKKMKKIQPKIQALQKEYKDDQATLGMKMLELYKAEGVNPMGSIAPMFIQMPILIGLYWVISQINDPSNFYHLYSILQIFVQRKFLHCFMVLIFQQLVDLQDEFLLLFLLDFSFFKQNSR